MDAEQLRRLLAKLAARHRVPGAQLVVHRTGETVAAEVGEEEHGSSRPLAAGAAIPLGSLTKPFTATLAMMLVADGDVRLDTPLAEYLPEPVPAITLRQVLSHTSGLVSDLPEHTLRISARSRWVARHCRPDVLVHRPGTVFSYSNVGYLLAGHLVEVITGMDWWEAVDSILLRPLGIRPSFVVGPAAGRPAVPGHTARDKRSRVLPVHDQNLPEVEAPTGALALSAADLVTFARMHLGDPRRPGLLDPDTAEQMRCDQTASLDAGPFGLADGWSLGWAVYRRDGRIWYGHEGTGTGTSCHLRFDPASGTVVAFGANASTGLAMWPDVVDELGAAGVAVGSYPLSSLAGPAPAIAAPPTCLGRYANGDTDFIVVGQGGDKLRMLIGGEPYADLTCVADLRFTLRELDGDTVYIGRFLAGPGGTHVDRIQTLGRVARRCG